MDTYRDWIPDGVDKGAQGRVGNVFKDYVPQAKPEVQKEVVVEKAEIAFKCENCQFVAKSAFGLLAHKKKHEVKVK